MRGQISIMAGDAFCQLDSDPMISTDVSGKFRIQRLAKRRLARSPKLGSQIEYYDLSHKLTIDLSFCIYHSSIDWCSYYLHQSINSLDCCSIQQCREGFSGSVLGCMIKNKAKQAGKK